jgi:hypothetical protein
MHDSPPQKMFNNLGLKEPPTCYKDFESYQKYVRPLFLEEAKAALQKSKGGRKLMFNEENLVSEIRDVRG